MPWAFREYFADHKSPYENLVNASDLFSMCSFLAIHAVQNVI